MRTRQPITEYFRKIHRRFESRADCRGCTQPTCSDPDSAKSMYQACYGWMQGQVERINESDPFAEAKISHDPEYPRRYAVTALRNGEAE